MMEEHKEELNKDPQFKGHPLQKKIGFMLQAYAT